MNPVDLTVTIGYFLGVAGSAVFVSRFFWARWWRTPEGRAVMGLHVAWAWLGMLAILRLIYGVNYPFRSVLATIGVYGLLAAVWSCTWLMFRAQKKTRHAKEAQKVAAPD